VHVEVDERGRHGRAIVLPLEDGSGIGFAGQGPPAIAPRGAPWTVTRPFTRPRASRFGEPADSSPMSRMETEAEVLRDRALALAAELGIDPQTWYLRMLEESRSTGAPPDLGSLVRTYWELQRMTGRTDLRDEWRRLADTLWQDDAA
jgi:hypothetical protein